MQEVRPVRALLKALAQQPWKGSADHPLLESLKHLNALYDEGEHALPVGTDLNDRQAGAAIEGVVRDERWETAQLAVDTHGYTDVAMALAERSALVRTPRQRNSGRT